MKTSGARARELFNRYRNKRGAILTERDRAVVESLCLIGLMWTIPRAYRGVGEDNGFTEIAGFTSLGRSIFWWKALSSREDFLGRVMKFFYQMCNAAY
jgi:hypothetical protein